MAVHAYNPSIWEVDTGGSEGQGYPQLYSQVKSSLSYSTRFQRGGRMIYCRKGTRVYLRKSKKMTGGVQQYGC